MRIKNLLLKTIVVSSVLLLANCSSKESTKKRSFVDGDYEAPKTESLKTQNSGEVQRLERLLQEIEPIVQANSGKNLSMVNASQLIKKVLKPLESIVLNRNYLMDSQTRFLQTSSGLQLIPRLVHLYNQAFILAYKSNKSLALKTNILTKYKDIILWDCEEELKASLKGSCEFIEFYKATDSNNITYIMKLIHDQEPNSDEKLRIIKAAYDIKGKRVDGPLRFMLLKRISESFKLEKSGRISKKRLKRRLRQDANLFANIFKINNVGAETKKKYTQFVKEINPWLLSRNIDDAKNPAMTDLIKIAGRELIYKGNQLTPQIKKAIGQLGYRIGPYYEQGVDFQLDNLKGIWKKLFKSDSSTVSLNSVQKQVKDQTQNNPEIEFFGVESKNIINNLLGEVSFSKRDEYYFLAHQIFYGHYNIDDAASYWSMTNKDELRFMEATMSLLKLQIVNNIVFTNTRMNNFYNNNKGTKLVELLRESDREGSKIRKSWSKLIVRAKAMKNFSNRIIVKNSKKKTKKLEEISNSVDALTKNIKFLVTYPNMFPLTHVLASLEMKDTIRTFFGDFTIDSQMIIDLFFSGQLAPLFNFGNDGVPLDATEIIYAYYYSLSTEIFKTYSTSEVVKFSAEDFFKIVVKKLLRAGEKSLDEAIQNLVSIRKDYANSVQAMQLSCSEEREMQIEEAKLIEGMSNFNWAKDFNKIMKPRKFANNQISFKNLGRSIYNPTHKENGKAGKYIRKVFSRTVVSDFNKMRDSQYKPGAVQTVQLARTLLDVYGAYNKDGNQDKIEKIFKEQFQEYNRLKAKYVETYLEMDSEINGCEWVFLKRDQDLRYSLIFREVKFLENLFDDMEKELSSLTASERSNLSAEKLAAVDLIRQKYMSASQNAMFPQSYKDKHGYTKITHSRITTFDMDIYARVMSYLKELFPGQYTITAPASFETSSIYSQSDARFIYFDWKEKNRELAKRKFVSSGVKVFAESLSWAGEFPEIDAVEDKARIMVSMYKLNTVAKDPEVDCKSNDISQDVFKKSCAKVTAASLISYYKNILNFMNIDSRDEIILSLLGEEKKYPESKYEDFIKVKNEHNLYSYYDMIFRRVMSDENVTDPENTWFMETLLGYVDSVHKRRGSTYIFPYPETIEKIFIKNYETWIHDYFENNIEFLQEVKKQVDAGVEAFNFKYRTDKLHVLGKNKFGELNPLVSPLIYGKFTGFARQMDNRTSGYFSKSIKGHLKKINSLVSEKSQGGGRLGP